MNKSYQNFKKRVGKLAVTFALVGTTAAGGMAVATDSVDAATVKSGYTSTTVTLRKSASTKSAKLATIKKGAKVTILKTSGKWLKVKYNGKTGYVYKTYVKKTFTTKDYSGKFKLKTDLNVRKGPGTSFVKAGTLKKGTVVTVKGKTSNGWYTITYKGSTRYISASSKYLTKYVAPTPKPDPKPDPTPTPKPDPTPTPEPEKNNAPTISVNDTYTLVKGEDFDYSMLKATASDKEDGDLTSKIDFSGVVNTGKVGEYTVKLTVKDSKGATATKTVKVIVKDVAPVENDAPVINVKDVYTLTKGDNFDYAMLKATAFDKEDGDLTSKIDFSGVVDTGKVGDYTVKLTVKDSKGATTTKTVKVVVEDVKTNTNPVIAVDGTFQVKQNGKFEYSMLDATAYDKEDGDLTSKIKYEGSVDVKKVGKYTVTLTVTDSKGNVTKKDVIVSVVRNYRPVIKTPYEVSGYKVESRKDFNLSDLKVTTTDVETPNDVKVTYTIKDDAGKVLDKISTDQVTRLPYTVTINAVDGDGVEAYPVNVKVSVVPNKNPRISFKYNSNFIQSKSNVIKVDQATDTLTVEEKEKVTIADLKAIFNAVADDGYDSVAGEHDITSSIEVIPTQAKIDSMLSQVGEHTIKFQVSDNGKSAFKSVKLVVKANNKPQIFFNNNRVVDAHHNKYDKAYKIKLNQKFDIRELSAYAKDINAATGKENQGTTLESNIDNNVVLTNQQGTTVLTFKATDNKGATTTVKVGVIVEDYKDNMNAPEISYGTGTKVVNDVLEIQCEEGKTFTADEIQSLVKAVATDKENGSVQVKYMLFDTNKFDPAKPLYSIDAGVLNHKYTFRITATDNGDSNGENQKTTVKDVTIIIVNK